MNASELSVQDALDRLTDQRQFDIYDTLFDVARERDALRLKVERLRAPQSHTGMSNVFAPDGSPMAFTTSTTVSGGCEAELRSLRAAVARWKQVCTDDGDRHSIVGDMFALMPHERAALLELLALVPSDGSWAEQ